MPAMWRVSDKLRSFRHLPQTVDSPRGDAPLQLVFSGECLDGHDPHAVRRVVAGALKLDANRAARLFSGKRVVLRRRLDAAAAQRLIARFAEMGAVLRAEPEKPRPRRGEPGPTKAAPAAHGGVPRQRPPPWAGRPAPWIVAGLILGLVLSLGLGLNALWAEMDAPGASTSWGVANVPLPPAPASSAADVVATMAPADDEIPQDMTAEAVRDYRQRYLAAPKHKAFAISSRGAHAWHAGAASENEARERALAGCMQAHPPSDDGCRVVDADGHWEE